MFLLNGGNGKIIEFGLEVRIDRVVEIGLRLFLKVEIVDSCDVRLFSRGLVRVSNVVLVVVDFGVGIIISIGFFLVVHYWMGINLRVNFGALFDWVFYQEFQSFNHIKDLTELKTTQFYE
jgi:hypothetical protein